MELLGEVNREHSRGCVISDSLEDFREIRDPERGLKSGAYLAQSLRKTQLSPLESHSHPTVRPPLARRRWEIVSELRHSRPSNSRAGRSASVWVDSPPRVR
jgi:hypothetical protein